MKKQETKPQSAGAARPTEREDVAQTSKVSRARSAQKSEAQARRNMRQIKFRGKREYGKKWRDVHKRKKINKAGVATKHSSLTRLQKSKRGLAWLVCKKVFYDRRGRFALWSF